LSQKPKKQKGKKEKQAGTHVQMTKPSAPVPRASVESRHGLDTVTRAGRGFSLGELAGAGVPLGTARKWGVATDVRRRSTVETNVEALRSWAASAGKKPAKESEVKKVEKEIEEVAKEVEGEAKKEGAKVKKGIKKAEKEVEEAVEKPVKSRQRKKKPSTD
jgi:large subunit ribosomal protein L13e